MIQNINHIANSLEKMMFIYFIDNTIEFKKFLVFDMHLYKLNFSIRSPIPGISNINKNNLKNINGSEIKYISKQIKEYIYSFTNKNNIQSPEPLLIKYRYKTASAATVYEIFMSITLMLDENVYFDQLGNNKAHLPTSYRHVYYIINNAGPGGLTKSEFYHKTRFLEKYEREEIINDLLSQGKIKERYVGDARKRQKIYYTFPEEWVE